MHATSAVLDLVGLVYEAAGDRSLWPTSHLSRRIGASDVSLDESDPNVRMAI